MNSAASCPEGYKVKEGQCVKHQFGKRALAVGTALGLNAALFGKAQVEAGKKVYKKLTEKKPSQTSQNYSEGYRGRSVLCPDGYRPKNGNCVKAIHPGLKLAAGVGAGALLGVAGKKIYERGKIEVAKQAKANGEN